VRSVTIFWSSIGGQAVTVVSANSGRFRAPPRLVQELSRFWCRVDFVEISHSAVSQP
jgi:hypothetical protein